MEWFSRKLEAALDPLLDTTPPTIQYTSPDPANLSGKLLYGSFEFNACLLINFYLQKDHCCIQHNYNLRVQNHI